MDSQNFANIIIVLTLFKNKQTKGLQRSVGEIAMLKFHYQEFLIYH